MRLVACIALTSRSPNSSSLTRLSACAVELYRLPFRAVHFGQLLIVVRRECDPCGIFALVDGPAESHPLAEVRALSHTTHLTPTPTHPNGPRRLRPQWSLSSILHCLGFAPITRPWFRADLHGPAGKASLVVIKPQNPRHVRLPKWPNVSARADMKATRRSAR